MEHEERRQHLNEHKSVTRLELEVSRERRASSMWIIIRIMIIKIREKDIGYDRTRKNIYGA